MKEPAWSQRAIKRDEWMYFTDHWRDVRKIFEKLKAPEGYFEKYGRLYWSWTIYPEVGVHHHDLFAGLFFENKTLFLNLGMALQKYFGKKHKAFYAPNRDGKMVLKPRRDHEKEKDKRCGPRR